MDVEKLRELERRATPGPWADKWDDDGTGPFIDAPGGLVAWAFTEPEDAELAVALRNAAPEIIEKFARIEKLERVAECLRECWPLIATMGWCQLCYRFRHHTPECEFTDLHAALADLDGGKR